MIRRTAIKTIVAAALGLVGIKKKPKQFVADIPDGIVLPEDNFIAGYYSTRCRVLPLDLPKGRWRIVQIVFKKVE